MNGKYRLFLVLILFGISTCCFAIKYQNIIDIDETQSFEIEINYKFHKFFNDYETQEFINISIDTILNDMSKTYPLKNWSSYEIQKFIKKVEKQLNNDIPYLNFKIKKIKFKIMDYIGNPFLRTIYKV